MNFYQEYRCLILIICLITVIVVYLIPHMHRIDNILTKSMLQNAGKKLEFNFENGSNPVDSVPTVYQEIKPNLLSFEFDRDNYYTFDEHICPNNGFNMTVMILIMSAPLHRARRDNVRKTWGHYAFRNDIGFAFVIGSVLDAKHEDDLQDENYEYGDMLRIDFHDSYNNLTLKSVSSLNWIDTFCNQTQFFLKTDDDMFINMPRLLSYIGAHHEANRTIFGHVVKNWVPFRDRGSKYYLSEADFAPKFFMPFATGPAYLMTIDCVHDLFLGAKVENPLKLEDVFITGIVASAQQIERIDVMEFKNEYPKNRDTRNMNATVNSAITMHDVRPIELFDMWKYSEVKLE